MGGDSTKARFFLATACVWPLLLVFCFVFYTPQTNVFATIDNADGVSVDHTVKMSALRLRKIRDRLRDAGRVPLTVPAMKETKKRVETHRDTGGRRKPSTPLNDARLLILRKATPVDLDYVDVSNGNVEHPHMAALDESGNPGYVHDETFLRRDPPAFDFPNLNSACARHDNHHKMLTEKVFVDLEAHQEAELSGKPRVKLMCLVYSMEKSHHIIPNILQTWG